MDLGFLLKVWNRVKMFKREIQLGAIHSEVDMPHISGLRIFGRRVGLTMTFDIEG